MLSSSTNLSCTVKAYGVRFEHLTTKIFSNSKTELLARTRNLYFFLLDITSIVTKFVSSMYDNEQYLNYYTPTMRNFLFLRQIQLPNDDR